MKVVYTPYPAYEEEFIHSRRCSNCQGLMESVQKTFCIKDARPVDEHVLRCNRCGGLERLAFDLSAFKCKC